MGKLIDMAGEVCGKLTVLNREPNSKNDTRARWLCLCECGNKTVVSGKSLRKGTTKSCGCLVHSNTSSRTHGKSGTRFYRIWAALRKRCTNELEASFKHYGGRGITYDKRWDDFQLFYDDMFPSYSDNLTIERIDVNGNYCKENCTWITIEQQARNRRHRKDNKTGVTGVFYEEYFQKGNFYSRYTAHWVDSGGTLRKKSYSCKKYGKDEAFHLACEYRAKMIEQLNAQGAGYTETHGQ